MAFWGSIGRGLAQTGKFIGRRLPAISRTAADIGAMAGNRAGQEAWRYRDALARQQRGDELEQARFEAQTEQQEAERQSRLLRDQLTQFQLSEAQRQAQMAPKTPQEALERFKEQERAKQGIAAEFDESKLIPYADQATGQKVYAEQSRRGLSVPQVPALKQPDLPREVPALDMPSLDIPGVPKIDPFTVPARPIPQPPQMVGPMLVPPKEDTSVQPFELFRMKYPPTPQGQAQAAEDWQKMGRAQMGIPGAGTDLYEPGTQRYIGKWFAETGEFIPAPVVASGGGATPKATSEAGIESMTGLGVLARQFSSLEMLAGKRGDDAIGPVAGRMGRFRAQYDPWFDDAEKASLYQVAKDIQNQLVYLLSGKQINEKEYERLRVTVPDPSTPIVTFQTNLENFRTRLLETINARRQGKGMAPTASLDAIPIVGAEQPAAPQQQQPPHPAPQGQKWQRNRRTGQWRLVPIQ